MFSTASWPSLGEQAKDLPVWVASLNDTGYQLPHDFDLSGTADLLIA